MDKNEILAIAKTLEEDIEAWEMEDGDIEITVDDFEGFDEEWNEVDRPLVNEAGVDAFFAQLKANCISMEQPLYTIFHFDNFDVCWGYTSFDI